MYQLIRARAKTEYTRVVLRAQSGTTIGKSWRFACAVSDCTLSLIECVVNFFAPVEIVFRGVTTHQNASDNDTCLPEGSSLTLCCTASAGDNSLDTIQISTSEGSPIASDSGTKGKVCVDVKKSGNYSCRASTEHSSSQAYLSVCIDGQDDDENTEAFVGEAVGGVFFFLLIVIVVALIINKRTSWWYSRNTLLTISFLISHFLRKKDPEKNHLIEDFVPSSKGDEQNLFIA